MNCDASLFFKSRRRTLRNFHKRTSIAFWTIDNFICWLAQNPNLKPIHLICSNGDYSDGTFAAFVSYLLKKKNNCLSKTFIKSYNRTVVMFMLIRAVHRMKIYYDFWRRLIFPTFINFPLWDLSYEQQLKMQMHTRKSVYLWKI